MDELRRRYLAQQIELGGPELVTGGRADERTGGLTDERTGGLTDERTGGLTDERTGGLTDERAGGRADARGRRGTDAGAPLTAPESSASPPVRPSVSPSVRPSASPSVRSSASPPVRPSARPPSARPPSDWRSGAPPIPGSGLVIESPTADLLAPGGPDWADLGGVAASIAGCTKCFLCEGRTNVVPGEGNPRAELVLVGEGPGQTEDQTGRPFVGRAGELLTDILGAIGYARDQVFICNVVKCRPPQNRKPLPEEMEACFPYLAAQLRLIRPKVILALGATAAEALLKTRRSLSDLRLKVHSYHGIPLVVTYHPAALLRNPSWKKPTWDDVRIARQLVDR